MSQEATPSPNEFTHSVVSPLVNQTIKIGNQDPLPIPETPIPNDNDQRHQAWALSNRRRQGQTTGQRRQSNRRPSNRHPCYSSRPTSNTTGHEETDLTSALSTEIEEMKRDLGALYTRINNYTSYLTQSTINHSDLRSLITDSLEKILTKENL